MHILGLLAFMVAFGFVLLFSVPVWFAAKLVGARSATLLRSAFSLFMGMLGTLCCAVVFPFWLWLLSPLCFLLAFRAFLGTSFLGALLLGILALVGYAVLAHFLGGEVQVFPRQPTAVI